MHVDHTIKIVGVVASVVLPLFNIPLILKIRKRGSSKDFSLTWAFGIMGCTILMMPSVLITPDIVFKAFGVINFISFSSVMFYILKYHRDKTA
jgi:Mn2+/Fe2+ NRAMP family transporter